MASSSALFLVRCLKLIPALVVALFLDSLAFAAPLLPAKSTTKDPVTNPPVFLVKTMTKQQQTGEQQHNQTAGISKPTFKGAGGPGTNEISSPLLPEMVAKPRVAGFLEKLSTPKGLPEVEAPVIPPRPRMGLHSSSMAVAPKGPGDFANTSLVADCPIPDCDCDSFEAWFHCYIPTATNVQEAVDTCNEIMSSESCTGGDIAPAVNCTAIGDEVKNTCEPPHPLPNNNNNGGPGGTAAAAGAGTGTGGLAIWYFCWKRKRQQDAARAAAGQA